MHDGTVTVVGLEVRVAIPGDFEQWLGEGGGNVIFGLSLKPSADPIPQSGKLTLRCVFQLGEKCPVC